MWSIWPADMRDPGTGLLGNTLHTDNTDWLRKDSGIGAGIDSFYEYLLKVAILECRHFIQVACFSCSLPLHWFWRTVFRQLVSFSQNVVTVWALFGDHVHAV